MVIVPLVARKGSDICQGIDCTLSAHYHFWSLSSVVNVPWMDLNEVKFGDYTQNSGIILFNLGKPE